MRPGCIRRERGIKRSIVKIGFEVVWSRINDIDRNSTTKKIILYEREERHSVEGKVIKARWRESSAPEKIIILFLFLFRRYFDPATTNHQVLTQ